MSIYLKEPVRLGTILSRTYLPFFLMLLHVMNGLSSVASGQQKEDDWFIYLGNRSAPQAPRKSMSAAEALPPLPLPATPLRRTERKKPPQPDYRRRKTRRGPATP